MSFTARIAFLAVAAGICAQGSAAQVKQDRALVVVDKYCKRVVQPYRFTDNLWGTATAGIKGLSGNVLDRLGVGEGDRAQKADQQMRRKAVQSNWLPLQTEEMFGARAHQKILDQVLDRNSKIGVPVYALADAMLADLVGHVGEKYPYKLKIFVLKNDTRNALAMPGGYLYIDRGLLADPRYHDKARFALAHELAHVFQRHETRALQGLIVDSYASQKDLRKAIADSKNPAAMLKKVKIERNSYVRHQIDQELQADACSVRMLARAYPMNTRVVAAIQAFLKDLPADSKGQAISAGQQSARGSGKAGQLHFLTQQIVKTPAGRHPSSRERVANLRTTYDEVRKSR